MESDSVNAISWVPNPTKGPWKFYFYFNEIKYLSVELDVEFRIILRLENENVDVLAKSGASN